MLVLFGIGIIQKTHRDWRWYTGLVDKPGVLATWLPPKMQRCQKFPMSKEHVSIQVCRIQLSFWHANPGLPRLPSKEYQAPQGLESKKLPAAVFLCFGRPETPSPNVEPWRQWTLLAVLAVSHLIPIRNACRISCGKCPWVTILYMSRLRVSHGKGKIPITAGLVRWVNHL